MAGEDARLKAGLKSAEDELNLIKNQIQQTLLDIREHILDVTNPFNSVAPEMLDDDEEVSIEDGGGMGGEAGTDSESAVDGEGGDEIVEDEEGIGLEEDLESMEDGVGEEVLVDDGDSIADEYEDVPEDSYMDDGGSGGSGGGLMEMLASEPEDEEEPEGFELDDEEETTPEFEADIEDEGLMEPGLTEDSMPEEELENLGSSGDGVADAVSAALVADVDLLTMASLVRWTAVTRERLGANRLDILLDAYEMAGRISPQMKNVVRSLSALGDEDDDGIPVRDVVTAMVRMDGVINSGENRESNRLLGLLLDMDDDPLDHLAA